MTQKRSFEFRGAALALQSCDDHEVIISGPAETGKTIAALYKLNRLAREVKGLQGAIVRKTRADMDGTVLQTWAKVAYGYTPFGGEKPEWYDYPDTGSRVWVAGIDHPGKALSAERDVIVVNQAEELELADWETLSTRVTHRAGHVAHPQLIGDCNPGAESHWIKSRALRFMESRHEDNPLLFDKDGNITPFGVEDMAILDKLTGLRYKRLRLGLWVSAEGVIYEFTAAHQVDPFAIPPEWKRFRAIDFGYTHPFTCGWFAQDPDGRLYLYRQIYMTGRTVKQHAADIKRYSYNEKIQATVCDHDAEDMATLRENGILTLKAIKAVKTGIEKVEDRLKVQEDGRPRLMVFKDGVINGTVYGLVEVDKDQQTKRKPIKAQDEFATYIWSNHKTKDEPVKEDDHAMDMIRYAVMYLDGGMQTVVTVGGKRIA